MESIPCFIHAQNFWLKCMIKQKHCRYHSDTAHFVENFYIHRCEGHWLLDFIAIVTNLNFSIQHWKNIDCQSWSTLFKLWYLFANKSWSNGQLIWLQSDFFWFFNIIRNRSWISYELNCFCYWCIQLNLHELGIVVIYFVNIVLEY